MGVTMVMGTRSERLKSKDSRPGGPWGDTAPLIIHSPCLSSSRLPVTTLMAGWADQAGCHWPSAERSQVVLVFSLLCPCPWIPPFTSQPYPHSKPCQFRQEQFRLVPWALRLTEQSSNLGVKASGPGGREGP